MPLEIYKELHYDTRPYSADACYFGRAIVEHCMITVAPFLRNDITWDRRDARPT